MRHVSGDGVRLPPGEYAFVDGNAAGGVGIVIVSQGEERRTLEISTTVHAIFGAAPLAGLDTPEAVALALRDLRNVLAELAGAFETLRIAPPGQAFTLVHDSLGIGQWLQGRWTARDPRVRAILHRAFLLINEKGLRLRTSHQPGHRSTCAGRHDYAWFNGRADALATMAARHTP